MTAVLRYAAGQDLNLVERARSVTCSPAADANFPLTRLGDGYADAIFKFGTNAANPAITVDLAMLDATGGDNGNADTWSGGLPVAWAVTATGGGAVTQSSPGRGGAGSEIKLAKGAGVASVLKTWRVRAGERLTIEAYLRKAAAGVASAQLYNNVTKRYLTSGGAWQAAQAYFATEAASAVYVQKTVAFQVESFLSHQGPQAYLELTVVDTGAGGGADFAFVDDVSLRPTWNAIVCVGHNIDPGIVTELRSDTAAFAGAGTLEATVTATRPAFYAYLAAPSSARYLRLLMTGTQGAQSGAVFVGELVACYLETAIKQQKDGWEIQFLHDQARNTTKSGHVSVVPQSIDARRVLRATFGRITDASYREARDEFVRRCNGGQWPAIMVPIEGEDTVVHGRLDSSWRAVRNLTSFWQDDIVLVETPLPNPFAVS